MQENMGATAEFNSPNTDWVLLGAHARGVVGGGGGVTPTNQSLEASSAESHDNHFNGKDNNDVEAVAFPSLLLNIDASATSNPRPATDDSPPYWQEDRDLPRVLPSSYPMLLPSLLISSIFHINA